MINISKESMEFLKNYVFDEMRIDELTDENQEDIVMYLSKKFEDPISIALTNDEKADEAILNAASLAITEITSDW